MSSNIHTDDVIDRLLGLKPEDAVYALRHARSKVVEATQTFHHLAFFSPDIPAAQRADRLLAAALTAQVTGPDSLTAEYRQQLSELPFSTAHCAVLDGAEHEGGGGDRLSVLARYATTLSQKPAAAGANALKSLTDARWAVPDVIALAQIMGYVSFQSRMMIALAALQHSESSSAHRPEESSNDSPFVHPAHLPAPGDRLDVNGYTNATLGWRAWLPIQDVATLSDQQSAILDTSHPAARESDYYMLLVRQPALLEQRSLVYNAIMYAPGGAARSDRELAAIAVSRINGCVYCASVHAQRYEQLAKRNDVIVGLFNEPRTAGTTAREHDIIQAAILLTEDPAAFDVDALRPLLKHGMAPAEILDVLCATAIFAWANRLMMNLGEHVVPQDGPSWSEAPAGWDWLAQDEDGTWYWYSVEPQLGMAGGIWRSPRLKQQFAAQGTPNPLWYESCRHRT